MIHARPIPITIRQANQADSALLSHIGAEAFSDPFGADNTTHDMELYLRDSFSPEIQNAELADPSSFFLIAEVNRQPAGYARLREGSPPAAVTGSRPIEIVRFYARTRWIGRGVGPALMHACLEEAQARGCDTIWLDVWERNKRARAFYDKWGFKKVGTQPLRLGNDVQSDLIMQRPVSTTGRPNNS